MFADDTNLFYSGKDILHLFSTMNTELEKVSQWFRANKLSLNATKTKFSLFHPTSKKRLIPNDLPKLAINNTNIKRDTVTKFLGVLIDESLTWKSQIDNLSTKVSKSIGVLYKSRNILNKALLKQLYFSFVHSYLSYANIAWASAHKTKLSSLYRNQKHAVRIINLKDRFTHAKPLFQGMKILSLFEINLFQILCFMFKCKVNLAPQIFQYLFTLKPENKYTTRSAGTLIEPLCRTKLSQFSISFRGPHLWNKLVVQKTRVSDVE